jgi:molecular chaperone DnaJ
MFRLRGKGLPRIGRGGRGDLHVRVQVWTPERLTAEQQRLFEELAKVESEPPSVDGLKKFWQQIREVLGA